MPSKVKQFKRAVDTKYIIPLFFIINMDGFEPEIRRITEGIKEAENKRRRIAGFLRSENSKLKLFQTCTFPGLKNGKTVAIDGGLVKKSFHGIDCMLVRAVGVCFWYEDGKVKGVEYFPSKSPAPKPYLEESFSDIDWAYFTSVIRQKTEMEAAVECLKRFEPDVLLLDGPIVPHHSDRPGTSSRVFSYFQGLTELCRKLHAETEKRGVCFAGIVEDSRSNRFCGVIKDMLAGEKADFGDVLEKSKDTPFLSLLLEKNERSVAFPYSKNPLEHPVLKEFEYAGNFYSFYLRTAAYDRPVRVDFIRKDGIDLYADKLASLLLSISGQNPHYGFPAPLIEADNAAKLSEEEMDNFYYKLLRYIGDMPGFMKLRREERPF